MKPKHSRTAKPQSTTAAPSSPAGRTALSPRQKWLFRLTALLLPALLLVLLEAGLRLGGFGYDPSFFKSEADASGKKFLLNNDEFTLRFFPPELARWPGTIKLAAEKPAGVQRIYIFGESAAMGDRTWHRVLIGPFREAAEAERVRTSVSGDPRFKPILIYHVEGR